MSTTCPIARCGLAKRADQLMCRAHWLMVDRDLRAEIWKLYDPTAKRQSHDYWVKVKEAFRLARRERWGLLDDGQALIGDDRRPIVWLLGKP